ncbi:translation initiation factor eIF-2B subunit epsilon-like isoform X4 [Tripterygium wilfordii]|uniref:Translation initiation factor eIF2B subunit epsilon n=1 Tax=Tripterygium wilfordii TaxID=458696 RepID=A0A7J7CZL2_TRIWF|nr:translation initiation factor eIF-2B subunit epsilon-like [Tripterygium wilfordii]KAF5739513.1 translation initiation factor eIF-2B subunit epsilon-like isoform X4 [Tripterygium wilfordii]
MGAPKKGAARVTEDPEELTRTPLQAILLADSFATKFRPITLERPKVLLPLVNVPMIDYTLAWLESAEVEEVFVFCCAHSKQVIDYLENSEWFDQPNFRVTTIESHNSVGAGDALRLIYDRHVIHGDFILISGDTVSNMSLTQVLQEHKERRKKDTNAVMTMVIKQSKASPIAHQSRLGTEELFMAIDPNTKQLLYYEEKADHSRGTISLDCSLLADKPSITLHNDKQDCYIDICSQEVLTVFKDNFDYQHLRRHFVKGLLMDDITGYKIFSHEINSSYAARIDNYRSYDTISKDIIQRWTYPYVPDVIFSGNDAAKLERQGMYRASEIEQSRSAKIGPFTVIGKGTRIGNDVKIANSVVGNGCKIGSNVVIEGSYIWDNVIIEDHCELRHAIVCSGVTMRSGAVLEPGVVLSFKVIIGQKFVVPAYSKVSLLQQPIEEDSDEELEYAENSSGTVDSLITGAVDKLNGVMTPAAEVGDGGAGYIWSICEGGHEEEWRHSIAPIPADKLAEAIRAIHDDLELLNHDGNALSSSGEVKCELDSDDSEDDEDPRDFEQEVEATFQRAVLENIEVGHVILEVNSLRLAYNMNSDDCAGALFYSMMKLALENSSGGELLKNAANVISTWQKLLKSYLREIDEQIEVLQKLEEMCLESAKEFAPLFAQILHYLYEKDLIAEEAILRWADEKKDADESDKVFVKQSEKFIQWLREADEEEEEEDDDVEDD